MSSLRFSMTEILANIASIDFRKISDETVSLLGAANKTFNDPKLQHLLKNADDIIRKASTAVDTLNGSITPEKLNSLMTELDQTVKKIGRAHV